MQIDKETQIDHQQTNSDIRDTRPDNKEMQNDHGVKQNDFVNAQNYDKSCRMRQKLSTKGQKMTSIRVTKKRLQKQTNDDTK